MNANTLASILGFYFEDRRATDWKQKADDAKEARAELEAMRTPITAESLLADGWEVIPGAIDWYRRVRPDPEFFDVYIGPDPTGVIRAAVDHNDTGVPEWLDGLKTMHDLYELLRIVGA